MVSTVLKRLQIRKRNLAAYIAISGAVSSIFYHQSNFAKCQQHTSYLTGQIWIDQLLTGHPTRIKDNLGISKKGFRYLENLLIRKTGFQATRFMGTSEQLGIFLYAVTTNLSMRKLAERFQRSTETINRVYHKVMNLFLRSGFYQSIIINPTAGTLLSKTIKGNNIYFPYFKDCIGAIDGTHIPVSLPEDQRAMFRNRKGWISQNVLAACDFDMKFISVLSGWEGSVSDSTLWLEARRTNAIQIPIGKYVLGDAGFANCDNCITPYRGVRYHLKEWAKGNKRPQNKEELFNLRHSRLRNVIERIFGILKGRFKILRLPREFKMETQARIVSALCVLHNILINIKEEEYFEDIASVQDDDNNNGDENIIINHNGYTITAIESKRASAKRNQIATEMWNDYIAR